MAFMIKRRHKNYEKREKYAFIPLKNLVIQNLFVTKVVLSPYIQKYTDRQSHNKFCTTHKNLRKFLSAKLAL